MVAVTTCKINCLRFGRSRFRHFASHPLKVSAFSGYYRKVLLVVGRSRGFAFVYYESTEDAQRAKSNCEGGLDIDGKIARVDYSVTSAPHNPTPGIYMGRRREYVHFFKTILGPSVFV